MPLLRVLGLDPRLTFVRLSPPPSPTPNPTIAPTPQSEQVFLSKTLTPMLSPLLHPATALRARPTLSLILLATKYTRHLLHLHLLFLMSRGSQMTELRLTFGIQML